MVDLTYRDMRADDCEAVHEIVSIWSVARQMGGWPWPADMDVTEKRVQPYSGNGFVWAICRSDQLVGSVAVTGHDLGYYLHPDLAGQGIMSQAIRAALCHAFDVLDRPLVCASTWKDNPASQALLEKFGFFHWQTCYMHAKARGYPVEVRQNRLTRDSWQALRGRAQ